MTQTLRNDCLWLDKTGRRYRILASDFDMRNFVNGRDSRGVALRAIDTMTKACAVRVAVDCDDLLDPAPGEAPDASAERGRRMRTTLVEAFKQALFYNLLEPELEMYPWDDPNPLLIRVEPQGPRPLTIPAEFAFTKQDTYLIEVAHEVRVAVLRLLRPEYRQGVHWDNIVKTIQLAPDDIRPDVQWLMDKGYAQEISGYVGGPSDVVAITDAGVDWLSRQDEENSHEADIRALQTLGKGEFILKAGEPFAAKRLVLRVMQLAGARLLVADEYLDDAVFDFLGALDTGVEIRLLTGTKKPMFKPLLDALVGKSGHFLFSCVSGASWRCFGNTSSRAGPTADGLGSLREIPS